MKKLVFAAQVFGFMAMFPIVVFLEMNHAAGGSSESNSTSSVIQNTETISICLPEKVKDKMVNETFSITLKTLLLNKVFLIK